VFVSSLSGLGAAADCCSAADRHIRHLVQDADLVFVGEVANIEYGLSLPTGQEGSRVPYTFVTYRVDEVIRGQDPGHLLTLRFIGGLNRESGTYVRPSNAPQFDMGDQDILFVKDNTEALIPLVGAQEGRLRMIDGRIYSEEGQEILVSDAGNLLRGPRHILEEVATTDVAGQRFADDLGPQAIAGESNAIPAAQMINLLEDSARQFGRRPKVEVAQADASQPFAGPDLMPAAPPALNEIEQAQAGAEQGGVEGEVAAPIRKKGQ